MTEFWEKAFVDKEEMWGMKPAKSALLTQDFFEEKGVKNILIPGIGYGRNAKPFIEHGMSVTGIEISKSAVELARKHYGDQLTIYLGSVTQMPFDNVKYNGIFCYALIHLLKYKERRRLIENCYRQLANSGYMVFTVITKKAPNYGQGQHISKDRFEFHKGAKIFYYDKESVKLEFENFGLLEIIDVNENQPMYLIKCKKNKHSLTLL